MKRVKVESEQVQKTSLRLEELVDMDTLQTVVLAGARGLDQQVIWAHSCELPDPWRWLSRGELLMTVGYCIPENGEEQVQLIQRLHSVGVVGMMVGQREYSPELQQEMFDEANRLGFPVLLTQPEVPWSAVSRTVASMSRGGQAPSVMTLAKMYEIATSNTETDEFAHALAELLGIEFRVVDTTTGNTVMKSGGYTEETSGGNRHRSHEMRTRFETRLDLAESDRAFMNAMVLVHFKRIVEVHTDYEILAASTQAEEWDRGVSHLLAHHSIRWLSPELAAPLQGNGYLVGAFPRKEHARVAQYMALNGTLVAVAADGNTGILLILERNQQQVREAANTLGIPVGLSLWRGEPESARAALAEAVTALEDAHSEGVLWQPFEETRVSLFARSPREARNIVGEVFGQLTDDTERMRTLRDTLISYFEHDRSWQNTAKDLGIHPQTLGYRIRKIEELTGRDITRTKDIAELWFATQAWRQLDMDPETKH